MSESTAAVGVGLPWFGGERKVIPTGEGLPTTGLVGPWMAGMFAQVITQYDLPEGIRADDSVSRSDWNIYYFLDYGNAQKAVAAIVEAEKLVGQDARISISTVWKLECPKGEILWSTPDAAAKWQGDYIKQEVNVKTMRSKQRHEYHFVALPAAVAAAARAFGGKDVEFDVSELLDQNEERDIHFQREMIGDIPEKSGRLDVKAERANIREFEGLIQAARDAGVSDPIATAAENMPIPYAYSKLWQRKAALWEALGEPDPTKDTWGYGKKSDTGSQDLGQWIDVAQVTWPKAIWASVALVDDPREDAILRSGGHLQLPVILAMYKSEADARAAWEAERGEAPVEGDQSEGLPLLPPSWTGFSEAEFEEAFRKFFTEHPNAADIPAAVALGLEASEVPGYKGLFGI